MTLVVPTPIPPLGLPTPDASDLNTWAARMQELVRWMTADNAPGMLALGNQALTNAQHAESMALIAQSVAGFVGAWSGLTGPLSVPASCSYDGRFWILQSDLTDVTLAEPGVSPAWLDFTPNEASDISVNGAAAGLTATTVQGAIEQLSLRGNLCDNPYFLNYTRTPLSPAIFEPVTLTAGQFLVDRWKAGAGGFARQFGTQPVDGIIYISTGTLVHQMYRYFDAGETVTVTWQGTALASFNGGTPQASPIVHTFAADTDNPTLEFSGNGTNFQRVRINMGAVDLGIASKRSYYPIRNRAHFAQFYQRVFFNRQWTVPASGFIDRTTVQCTPMAAAPTASVISTQVNTNIASAVFSVPAESATTLHATLTATGAGAAHRQCVIALDTGF